MSKPLIGITTFHTDSQRGYVYISVTQAYVSALARAGAIPVMVPLGLSQDDLAALLQKLDGILFTGGGDIDPALYAGEPHPTVHDVDPVRDQTELFLVHQTVERELPFLGICRGLQIINVALGGSLYTHIQAQHPHALKHDFFPGYPRNHLAHPIQLREETTLARIIGHPIVQANSLHHQGIRRLAASLTTSAKAPDGIIEGVELPGHPFGLAVQWHPEWLQDQTEMQALFTAFVKAAKPSKSEI